MSKAITLETSHHWFPRLLTPSQHTLLLKAQIKHLKPLPLPLPTLSEHTAHMLLRHLLHHLLPLLLPTPLDITLHLLLPLMLPPLLSTILSEHTLLQQLHPLLPAILSDHTLLQLLHPLPTALQPTLSVHTTHLRTTILGLLRKLQSLQKSQSPPSTLTLSLHTTPAHTTTLGLLRTSQLRRLKSLLKLLPTALLPTLSAHTAPLPLRTTIPGLLSSQLISLPKLLSLPSTPTLSPHTAPLRTTTPGLLSSQLKSPLKLSLLRAHTQVASRLVKIQAPTLMPSLHSSTLLHQKKRSQLKTIITILTGHHPPRSLSLRLQLILTGHHPPKSLSLRLTDTPMDTVTVTDMDTTDNSHPTDTHGLTTITSHTHLLRRSTRPRSSQRSSSTTNTVSAHSPTRATPLTLFCSSRKNGRPRQSKAPSKAKA